MPRRRQLMGERVAHRAPFVGTVRIKALENFLKQVLTVLAAEDSQRGVQLARVPLGGPLAANVQGKLSADDQGVNMGLKTLLELPDARPGDFGIVKESAALVVEERGLFEVLQVKLDVELFE